MAVTVILFLNYITLHYVTIEIIAGLVDKVKSYIGFLCLSDFWDFCLSMWSAKMKILKIIMFFIF